MSKVKILVLEDHPLTLQMLMLTLKGLGYHNLHAAESGDQAFAILKAEGQFDVLICDIQMPGVDGLTFLRKASEVGTINALILSSEIAPNLRLAIQQLGRLIGYQVLGDLSKPISRDELKTLLLDYVPQAPKIKTMTVSEMPSATDIQRALHDGEFIPYFQPKVDLQSLEVVGAEVLVRWQHPRLGLMSPGQFLEIVQHYGFLDDMTVAIGRQALRFLKSHKLVKQISLAINLDASQLDSPNLVNTVKKTLFDEHLPAHCLTLEITETGLIHSPITSIENLVRLRLLGCGISIDDFGAGFSSLQRICEMPGTELKLDASFTRSMTHNPRSLAAVDSVLRLAKNLEFNVVAEGIETYEQLRCLQKLDCPTGQGYLFSKPLSEQDFLVWLEQHRLQALEG